MFTLPGMPFYNYFGIMLGLFAALIGCQSDAEQPAIPASKSEAVLSEVPDNSSSVAALVNGVPIQQQEVDRRLSQIQRVYRHSRNRFDARVEAQKRREVIDRLIDKELLHQHVQQREVKIPDDAVDSEIQSRITTIFGSSHALNSYLDDQDLDLPRYRARIRSELAVKTLCLADIADNTTDEADIRKLYEQLANRRAAAERVEASTIMIRVPNDASAAVQQNMRNTAERALINVHSPEQFAAIAKSMSYDPTSKDGGYLGWIEKGSVTPQIENVLFTTPPGQRTNPIVTSAGIEIYWIHQKRSAGMRHFDEVEDVLREHHAQDAIEQQRRRLIKKLRDEADIQYPSAARE